MVAADDWLQELKLDRNTIPRFRACFFDARHPHELVIRTRTGGNNRYCEVDELRQCDYGHTFSLADHAGHNCTLNDHWRLTQHPCYLRDEDDDFDNTYAYFYFSTSGVAADQ